MKVGQNRPVAPQQAPVSTQSPTTSSTQAATQQPRTAQATSDGAPEAAFVRSAAVSAPGAGSVATPREVVTQFYAAFVGHNPDAMEKLYAPDVKFKDAIFSYNDRAGTMHMWRKIMQDPTSKFVFTLDSVEGNQVKGHWVADYKLNGRKVHNEISTQMTVENGKITRHTDDFSWSKWAPQALPLGHLATLPGLKQLVQSIMRGIIDS